MGIKDFFLKQMLKGKLRGLPEAEQKRVLALVEANPEFFKKIGDEIEKRKKSGQDEMTASMEVMRKYQSELQKLMMP